MEASQTKKIHDFNGRKPNPDDPLGRINEYPDEHNLNSQTNSSTRPTDDNSETSNCDHNPMARLNENPNHPKPNNDGEPSEKITRCRGYFIIEP
jgi:hypothetical protein